MTSAPEGIASFGPIASNFRSLMRMIWSVVTVPVAGSISLPARTAV
jgi:hypothetical protein